MPRQTVLLRVLLTMLVIVLGIVSAVLYVVSLDMAVTYPTMAHLRVPLYLAAVVALAPVMVAVNGCSTGRLSCAGQRGDGLSPGPTS
jgi:hypothetical protein